jgi:hypothetical protein
VRFCSKSEGQSPQACRIIAAFRLDAGRRYGDREQRQRVIGRAIVCGFVASVCTARALAAEVCVVCTGPDATYRCTADQASKIERLRGGDRALHYMCITALAKAGGHTKCRVSRDGSGFCAGEARTIGPAELEAALADGGAGAAPGGDEGHEAAPKPAQPGPPRTVEELARRTTQTSSPGAPLEKASEAIGGAMKKSWLCIASLFTQC